jgi:hypothetical protein
MRPLIPSLVLLAGLPALVGCARESIRSRAASDFGCGSRHVTVEPVGDSEYRATGCGQSATYFYVDKYHPVVGPLARSDDDTARTAPQAPPASAPLLEPPLGAGGFFFGASEQDARRACEDAGHTYAPQSEDRAACDGVAADVGAPARARLTYCGGKVCAVSLIIPVAEDEDVSRALVRWKEALVKHYGGPTASHSDVPDSCLNDVTPCLLDRTGTIRFDWRWGSRQGITLAPRVDAARRASVSIAYVASTTTVDGTPGL